MLPGLLFVHVTNSMRSQIDLAILLVGQFVFPTQIEIIAMVSDLGAIYHGVATDHESLADSPLIEPHVVLDEEKYFVGKIGWPEGSSEVDLF